MKLPALPTKRRIGHYPSAARASWVTRVLVPPPWRPLGVDEGRWRNFTVNWLVRWLIRLCRSCWCGVVVVVRAACRGFRFSSACASRRSATSVAALPGRLEGDRSAVPLACRRLGLAKRPARLPIYLEMAASALSTRPVRPARSATSAASAGCCAGCCTPLSGAC